MSGLRVCTHLPREIYVGSVQAIRSDRNDRGRELCYEGIGRERLSVIGACHFL